MGYLCKEVDRCLPVSSLRVLSLLFICAVAYQMFILIHHDVAWYIYATDRFLHGQKLYVDIIETNPPLIFLLTAIPVLVSNVIGISQILSFKLCTFFLAALSLLLCRKICAAWFDAKSAMTTVILFVLTISLLYVPHYDFGQREHLFLILTLPYILMAYGKRSPLNNTHRFWVGVAAGIGFALKPYFVLLWLCLVAYTYLAEKKFFFKRPEHIGVVSSFLIYAGVCALAFPEYRSIIHIATKVYGAYSTYPSLILHRQQGFIALIIALYAINLIRINKPDTKLILFLLNVSVVLFFVGLIQSKGWRYHFVPSTIMVTTCVLLSVYSMIVQLQKFVAMRVQHCAVVFMMVLGAIIMYVTAVQIYHYTPPEDDALVKYIRQAAERRPVFFFSTALSQGFPKINYANAQWATRFHSLWCLPGCYVNDHTGYHAYEHMDAIEKYQFDAVLSDLERNQPELLLFHTSPYKQALSREFDFYEYFSMSDKFLAIMDHYEHEKYTPDYAIYRRKHRTETISSADQENSYL